jgi:hypothetical protein
MGIERLSLPWNGGRMSWWLIFGVLAEDVWLDERIGAGVLAVRGLF